MDAILKLFIKLKGPGLASEVIVWGPLAVDEAGAAFDLRGGDKVGSVQIFGEFGPKGRLAVEGSNDGEHFATLNDAVGIPLLISSSQIQGVAEQVAYVRPCVIDGDAETRLYVLLMVHKAR